jgi:hypothetical protein
MQSRWISDQWGTKLALLIPRGSTIEKNDFLTDSKDSLQIGLQTRGPDSPVKAHRHPDYFRTIKNTWEVLFFVQGEARCSILDDHNEIIEILSCNEGDFLIFLAGGHAIEFIGEVKFIEFKQGPYNSNQDKLYLNSETEN